jgi:hypothetical protein
MGRVRGRAAVTGSQGRAAKCGLGALTRIRRPAGLPPGRGRACGPAPTVRVLEFRPGSLGLSAGTQVRVTGGDSESDCHCATTFHWQVAGRPSESVPYRGRGALLAGT